MGSRTGLPKHVRKHSGGGYRAVFTVDFRRHYGPVMETPEECVAYAKARGALAGRGDGTLPLTLKQAVELLYLDLGRGGARSDTVAYYRKYTKPLLRRWGDDRLLHSLDHRSIAIYLAERERKVSLQTVYRHELQVLRRLFRVAIAAGRLPKDPTAAVKVPKLRRPRFAFLEAAEVLRVVAAILGSDKPARRLHADVVLLFFYTGLRLAEVGRLRVRDFIAAGKAATLWIDGKTDNRHQPVPETLRPSIARLARGKEPDDPLVGRGKRRLSSRVFDLWRERLDLPKFSPHVLRHSYATAMVRLGVSPFDLQILMGHRSITQTMRYYHAVGPDLQRAADALGGLRPARERGRRRAGAIPGRRAASGGRVSGPPARSSRRRRSDGDAQTRRGRPSPADAQQEARSTSLPS